MTAPDAPCPCGWGEPLAGCCGRYLDGRDAPTAEALMRSRYTAFAVGDVAHLLRSWHPDTRPADLDLDPELEWKRLVVLGTDRGSPFDDTGTVEFEAHYRQAGRRGVQHEESAFVRVEGRWVYEGPTGNRVA
ncbi:YchJ family metal-binding protein [Kineococcus aurantiacus]|uniref:SEC-C motif-containing protein n=1 Tax=Kineococcus aurantiacus TaxID=37633 RepID=A0A7Y9DLD4_9ACTN|nr:SEC-C motif-containing protein [Kineococcus aurantiacus]